MAIPARSIAGLALTAMALAGCDQPAPSRNDNAQTAAKPQTLGERCTARRKAATGERIVNGEPAAPGSARWQAQLFTPPRFDEERRAFDAKLAKDDECKDFLAEREDFELQHRCGGSYIGGGWVITAAHCVINVPGIGKPDDMVADASGKMVRNPLNGLRYLSVRLGTQNLTAGGAVFGVDAIVIHGDYVNEAKVHDIALIRLKDSPDLARLEKEGRLAAIPMAPRNDPGFDPDEQLRVTGWGWTGYRKARAAVNNLDSNGEIQRIPPELQQLTVRYLPDADCKKEYKTEYGPGSLCVGALEAKAQEGTCQGDSGGPLTRSRDGRRELVGLVSFARGCAAGLPTVFTRVSAYQDWIASARKAARPAEIVMHPGRSGA